MGANLQEQLVEGWQRVAAFFTYELVAVEGSSITVGKVGGAILLVILGLWASRWISRLIGRRLLRRFRLAEGAVAAIQTLIFYFLILAFCLWALRLVNIPLTAFTFLGGAVAIGVGFGSQNIVNNFISGLILIAERPVKVGDLIDIDGLYGRVEKIGARSTRVVSGDNTHIILPNSNLLENKVLNWTLSDNVMRTHMDIGVAYGSDVAEVKRRLEEALKQCTSVMKEPAPEVLFLDFGDNALVFRSLFWTQVRAPLDQLRAQSEVRFQVDESFRAADITVAFPQCDVHLDGLGPIVVQIQNPGQES